MKTVALISLLLACTIFSSNAQVEPVDSCQGIIAEDSLYVAKIHASLPAYQFHAIVRDKPCFTLMITRQGGPDTIQRIEQSLGSRFYGDGEYTKFFQLVDLNYDGFMDLQLFNEQPDPSNILFSFWLYNPKTAKFEYNTEMSQTLGCNPFIHPDVRTVTHRSNGSGESYTWQKHRFQRGRYVLVEEENQSFSGYSNDKPIYIRTLRRLKGGSLRVVKQVKGTLEQIFLKWYKDPKYWEAEEAERDARGGA